MKDDMPPITVSQTKEHQSYSSKNDDAVDIEGEKSLGVKRVEALSAQLSKSERIVLFISIFFIAYCYGLDILLRSATYQPVATAALGEHSQAATIAVVRSVIAAATQPAVARAADVFGRVEMLCFSIVLYIIGTVVEASTPDVAGLAAGSILYQLAHTTIQLLIEVIISDFTSLRSRAFYLCIPSSPFIINAWVSGDVAEAVLGATTWRWGFGMWAIIYPVCALPLLISLWVLGRRAKRAGQLESFEIPHGKLSSWKFVTEMFWHLDIIGMVLITAILGLILVPLSLAGGVSSAWKSAGIITPLVLGFICIPVFVYWERVSKHPTVPFHLLHDRGVWAALGVGLFLYFAYALQANFLFTVLIVAFDQSIKSSTRIASLYNFAMVLAGISIGILARFVKQLKWFIVAGTALFTVAFGLLIKFRGGTQTSGVIGAQVLLGIGAGMFMIATLASLQSCTTHEHTAIVTSLYFSIVFVGAALGQCVSGAYWSNTLPGRLESRLGNSTLAQAVFADPFGFSAQYSVETPERQAVVEAYRDTQKVLCTIGICITLPIIAFGLCLRNHKLDKEQSRKEEEL